jgi:L-Ala-D/L-Glu epimerase / N-acetyl-D-glutamate racemase
MKITSIESWLQPFELTRPYTIAFDTISSVENAIVKIVSDDGSIGLGAASPYEEVTGESISVCMEALQPDSMQWLQGSDLCELPRLCRQLRETIPSAHAARAAVDMALHDLWAQHLGAPLVDVLGRAHTTLPTSITIGIMSVEEALEEADEYLGRGFRILKVKLGHSLDEDLERLAKIRENVGEHIGLRVDPNQGYSMAETERFVQETEPLNIELLEQPMKADDIKSMRALPESTRRLLAADESLHGEADALALVAPPVACGIFNIKLMKCGGVTSAMRIAAIAETAGVELMWGCMDESIISITAALHAALASPATRYLDLDGSLDLARDIVEGGFVLEDGCLRTSDAPGLGLLLLA